MIFLRLQDQLVELPTATALADANGRVVLSDASGLVVARFDKSRVFAWSADPEKLSMGLEPEGSRVGHADGSRIGESAVTG